MDTSNWHSQNRLTHIPDLRFPVTYVCDQYHRAGSGASFRFQPRTIFGEAEILPVCGHDSIEPVPRRTFMKVQGDQEPLSDVLAYRCSKGHLFSVESNKKPNVEKS
jgi:hypothetical protein